MSFVFPIPPKCPVCNGSHLLPVSSSADMESYRASRRMLSMEFISAVTAAEKVYDDACALDRTNIAIYIAGDVFKTSMRTATRTRIAALALLGQCPPPLAAGACCAVR